MNWINHHVQELQVVSGLIIAFLTIVLIVLNVLYTRANWRIMRMMDADMRFKTQPIPSADITVGTIGMTARLLFIVKISTANAPLRLEEISIFLTFTDETKHTHIFPFNGYRIIPVGESVQFQGDYPATEFVTGFHTTVTYQDLGGSTRYVTTIIPNSHIPGGAPETVTTRVVSPKSLLSRAISKFRPT